MVSAGLKVNAEAVKRDAVEMMKRQDVKPAEVRERLKKQLGIEDEESWAVFKECADLAAQELRRITPEGRPIASGLWRNYFPKPLMKGTHKLSPAEKAWDFFKNAGEAKVKHSENPDVEYILDAKLTNDQRKLLVNSFIGVGNEEGFPLVVYTPVISHDGFTKGETYWLTKSGAEAFSLTDPKRLAELMFRSKKPQAMGQGWMVVEDGGVNHSEAGVLKEGGYKLAEIAGKLYWLSEEGVKNLGGREIVDRDAAVKRQK